MAEKLVGPELKKLISITLFALMPLILLAFLWSAKNAYPFGNHDAGFHYAHALGDKDIYYKYFWAPLDYYRHYPPVTAFVTTVMMKLNPFPILPDYIKFDIAMFLIMIGVILAFHYFYRDYLAATFLLFSPLFLVFHSTLARLLLLIAIFALLKLLEQRRFVEKIALGIGMTLIHSKAFYIVLALLTADAFFRRVWDSRYKPYFEHSLLFLTIVFFALGIWMQRSDLVFMPLVGGLVGWYLLDHRMQTILLISSVGAFFLDPTITFLSLPFLSLGLARMMVKYDAPKWFKITVLLVLVISYFTALVVQAVGFMATDIELMSKIVATRAGYELPT